MPIGSVCCLPAGLLLPGAFHCSGCASGAGRAEMEAGGGEQRSRGPGEHLTRDSSRTDGALHAIAGTTQRAAKGFSDTHALSCSSSFSQPSCQRHRVLLGQRERSALTRAQGIGGRAESPPCLCSPCSPFLRPPLLTAPLPQATGKAWMGMGMAFPYNIHGTGVTGGRCRSSWLSQPKQAISHSTSPLWLIDFFPD